MPKFRTMKIGTKDCPTHMLDKSKITFLGSIIRKTKIDEIPQFLNVLKMDMSIIGPRPIVEKEIKNVVFKNAKLFKYSSDSKILTGQIEKLTNYKRRKINLDARIKKLEESDLSKDIRELNQLKQKYTLGKVKSRNYHFYNSFKNFFYH